jgi:leucyl aminopeptidase
MQTRSWPDRAIGHNERMPLNESSRPVLVTVELVSHLDVDLLAVPVFEKEPPPDAGGVDGATAGQLRMAVERGEFAGKPHTVFLAPVTAAAWRAGRVMLVGLGPRESYSVDRARKWATAAGLAARDRKLSRVALLLPGVLPGLVEAQALAEGVTLAAFHAGTYKNDSTLIPALLEPQVVASAGVASVALHDLERAVSKGYILGACSNLARALANEPANAMTPRAFAEAAEQVAAAGGLTIDVLDEDRLTELNMRMLLAVARGSSEPPRLVVLRYAPPTAVNGPVLGLVGKGVTFDTGGISIKAANRMHLMKTDMSGGAAVLGAMKAIAALKPDIPVIGVIPLAENMPDGRACRPGDVVRSADGRTVEILDTDAEGRLILGDALWYAASLGATHLVDVATLTGACVVALGETTSGLFGSPHWWASCVHAVTERTGDRSWIMPMFDDYKDKLRSEIADLANIGGRAAGAITAAIFLKEFAGGLPWAHLDIAGTAWADEAQPWQLKGPTGVGVRALAELALSASEWREGETRA